MVWFDCAIHKPLGPQNEPRLVRKNKVIYHTMVGSLPGTDAYFRKGGYDGTESHFGTGPNGEVWQWQDSDFQADANLQANDDAISVETADKGFPYPNWTGSAVPPWTAGQIEANARILAEANRRYGIPLSIIPNTLDATKGVGYHRQGVDPYRRHGELYSNAYGKVCPGDTRINQLQQVIDRARQILGGVAPPQPPAGGDTRPVLKPGAKGAHVTRMQHRLLELGYSLPRYGADGDFGAETVLAVKALQNAAGITSDGIVGPQTWNALDRGIRQPNTPPPPPPPTPQPFVPPYPGITKQGMRNSPITAKYQERLKHRGWPISIDGDHGPATTATIKKFQAEKGLPADGIGGPKTWNALWTAAIT